MLARNVCHAGLKKGSRKMKSSTKKKVETHTEKEKKKKITADFH